MIVKENNKYVIYSKKGKKLGEFDSKEKALKRLRQIEYFKSLNKTAEFSQPTDSFLQKYFLQNLDYANYVLQHKYNVAKAGIKTNLPPSTILLHDWSKFKPSIFAPYKNFFYGEGGVRDSSIDPQIYKEFRKAVEQHYKAEKHHSHIFNIKKDLNTEVESVADWWSVGKTKASISNKDFPDFKQWWDLNKFKLVSSGKISREAFNYIEEQIKKDSNLFEYMVDYLKNKFKNFLM